MLLTLGGPILLCASVNGAFNYNVLPDVSYNVVRRIFPHAKEQDIITVSFQLIRKQFQFIEDINSCKETEKRKDITLDFVENKFVSSSTGQPSNSQGTKLSRTDSPFDDHEYALHKMWSLLDQRAALVKFFDQANSQLKEKITMGLSSEVKNFLLEKFLVVRIVLLPG